MPGRWAKVPHRHWECWARVGVAAADRGGEHHRHLDVAAGLEVDLGHVVVDLVQADADEVDEHQLDDRAASPRPPRRWPSPMNAVSEIGVSITRAGPNRSSRPVVGAEDAAVRADVLAEVDHRRVALHLERDRLDHRLGGGRRVRCRGLGDAVSVMVMTRSPQLKTYDVAVAGSGSGLGLGERDRPRRRARRPPPRSLETVVSSSTPASRSAARSVGSGRGSAAWSGRRGSPGRRPRSGPTCRSVCTSISVGPSPARARATARPAASYTASTSLSSIRSPGMP